MATEEIAPQDYIEQTVAASRARARLFAALALIVLTIGIFLCPRSTSALLAGLVALSWLLVQGAAALYLRTRPRHATVGLVLVVAIVTVAALTGVSLVMTDVRQSVVIAGTWLAGHALIEAIRGHRWRTTIDEETESGAIVRGLAAYVGYDGAPVAGFVISGLLVGLTAAGLFLAVWLVPFALVLHIGTGLGLAFAHSLPRSA